MNASLSKSLWRAALCVLAVSLLTGTSWAADEWDGGAGEDWRQVLAAARKEGRVVIAGPPALARPFSEGFKRDTGLTVDYLGGNPRELSARMFREATAGNLTIDLSLGGGSELLSLYPKGLLKPIAPQFLLPTVRDKKYWIDQKIHWMDNAGQYFFRGSRYVVGWPVVNSRAVKPDTFVSWEEFLKPEYKGKIAAYDPRAGGPGQGVAAYIADRFGTDFLKALYQGQNVRYTQDSQQLVEWVARGTFPIVIGSIQQIVEKFRKEGLPLAAVAPDDGRGYLSSGFSVLKQPKGSPNPNAATVFINWYASKPGQEAYSRAMLEASTRVDVETPEVPDYVRPKPGYEYLDTYTENWYVGTRPKIEELVVEALGGK
jgi:ABC-type Fe3+ transport system substrate-binding protein